MRALLDEQLTFVQLEVADVLLRRCLQIVLEQCLQGRARYGKLMADLLDRKLFIDMRVDVLHDLVEQFAFKTLLRSLRQVGFFRFFPVYA